MDSVENRTDALEPAHELINIHLTLYVKQLKESWSACSIRPGTQVYLEPFAVGLSV